MQKHLPLTLTLLLLLIAAPTWAGKPDWVKQRPSSPDYYIGLANCIKAGKGTSYMTETRAKALQQMAGEIEITISSNSILHQVENNNEFYHNYESKINSSILQSLEGYEFETWENKKEYWVMVRLSKQKHKALKEIKLDRAKMNASIFIDEAHKAANELHPYAALEAYFKAALAVKDILDADLTYKNVNGMSNVGIDIYKGIASTLRRITIEARKSNISSGRTGIGTIQPQVVVGYQHGIYGMESAAGIPVKFQFSGNTGSLAEEALSDQMGEASTTIQSLNSGIKNHQIIVKLNLNPIKDLFKDNKEIFDFFVGKTPIPQTIIRIELEKVLASFNIAAVKEDENNICASLNRNIKTLLNQNFFTFTTNEEAPVYHVAITPIISKGDTKSGNGYVVYVVYGGISITITEDLTGNEIFTHNISGLREIQPGSYDHAIAAICRNIYQKFEDEVVPAMQQLGL